MCMQVGLCGRLADTLAHNAQGLDHGATPEELAAVVDFINELIQ